MSDLTKPPDDSIIKADLERTAAAAAELAKESLSPATRRAYATDWAAFEGFCAALGRPALPAEPEAVVLFLTRLAEEGLRYSSIERALTSVTHFARKEDPAWSRAHPAIAAVMKGLRRQLGTRTEKKDPLDDVRLREIVTRRPPTLLGTMERAVLLFGWLSSLRRSEIVALDVPDVVVTAKGLEITVRKSKTDQAGKGRVLAIIPQKDKALCAVEALDRWLTVCHRPKAGPLFPLVDARTGKMTDRRMRPEHVAEIVKRAVKDVGIDPDSFAGHSLRRGFATTAAAAGVSIDAIQRQTGHKSLRILIEHYISPATAFSSNATKGLL